MGRTLQMFERPKISRVIRMHVSDAGHADCMSDDADGICKYRCRRCGHETDWTEFKSTSEAKRGIPCPHCNAPGKRDE